MLFGKCGAFYRGVQLPGSIHHNQQTCPYPLKMRSMRINWYGWNANSRRRTPGRYSERSANVRNRRRRHFKRT